MKRHAAFPALVVAACLAGCASYKAKPLDQAAPPHDSIAQLQVDAAGMPSPALRQHRFDPSDGLDATETAMLAVANSPDLRLLRDDLGIQQAQAFSAGLLPDPQFNASQDFPLGPDASVAWALGLTEDLSTLMLRSKTVKAAQLDTRAVQLNLLWAEWQVVSQAHSLFDRVLSDRELLRQMRDILPDYESLHQSIRNALQQGNLSADTADGPLLAASDLKKQIADTAQRLDQEEHDLRTLLGLGEKAPLPLVAGPEQEGDAGLPADIDQRLAALPQRRPDLMALRAGYEAEELRVRLAVLQQFPAITAGVNRARDNTHAHSIGYTVGLTLPIFNRNRGGIALEQATRQRMFDEYQARLASARSDVDRARIELPLEQQQLREAGADAAQLERDQRAATAAFHQGRLDWNTYLTLTTSALGKKLEVVQLRLSIAEQINLLNTLLGSELPASN